MLHKYLLPGPNFCAILKVLKSLSVQASIDYQLLIIISSSAKRFLFLSSFTIFTHLRPNSPHLMRLIYYELCFTLIDLSFHVSVINDM